MYDKENKRVILLFVLMVYTILSVMLIAESTLLGWDKGAVMLLALGVAVSWGVQITEKISEQIRIWLYFVLSMLAFFFYGIHETSVFDMAPLMIVIIILYSSTGIYAIIKICIAVYFLTMFYDLVFVLGSSIEFSSLVVSRILLHLVLVYVAGYLVKFVLQKHGKEIKSMSGKINELEETNRRTDDFLTNVSHELRTPINAVTGITSVMLKNEENPDKIKDISSVHMAGHRLFSQIEDILDYTEIDTGRIKVSEDTYIISSLINDVINSNRLSERENSPELIFDVDAEIPSVLLGDEKKIKRILRHLIDNAFKFTKKGGIYVRIYALPKDYGINLCISVSDTGIGIAEEELEKIKERFYQSSGGRNRKAGGLGLGLPIVYGMVSAMEGFLQIESTLGEGSTVSVSIPQKVVDDAPGIVVSNRETLCVACYLKPEKYEIPKVREFYDEMISNMVREMDISLHRVFNYDELEKLTAMYKLTHLFLGVEEYKENEFYFKALAQNIQVIVVADDNFVLPQGSGVKVLKKPFYSLPIANILNVSVDDEELNREKQMICPGVRVLVVDDEPMNLMVAKGIFNDYKMKVATAESGAKAIEICEKEDFDLIFLDHMMPDMDGVETLKRLRKICADTARVFTVIAFTANAVSGAREMFLREGFNEFVSKPIELAELERVLRKVLPKLSIGFVDKYNRKNKIAEYGEKEIGQDDENIFVQTPEKDVKEDRLLILESVGININSGLQYCRNDREFYEELLIKFSKDAQKKSSEIEEFYKQEDYDNYRIVVHALKSTSKMIGADLLSENARKAEAAAKNHDSVYIREHHEELLAGYCNVVQSISDVFGIGENISEQIDGIEDVEISRDELLRQLADLKDGLDTFEADKAESLISKMGKAVYNGMSVEQLLCDVSKDVDDFEFTSAIEKVEALIVKVEGGEV